MRGAAFVLALAASLSPAAAQNIDISQACFPEFCVESREPFMRLYANVEKGQFTIKVFSSDRVIAFFKRETPDMPDCTGTCRIEETDGARRAVHARMGTPLGRVFGPFANCKGEGSFYVVVRVYLPMLDLDKFEVERSCG